MVVERIKRYLLSAVWLGDLGLAAVEAVGWGETYLEESDKIF